MAEAIDSGKSLENIDTHFKITAGPGAGKTYWLINHVKNVLSNSKKMSPASWVACISYTNVAAKEIRKELGDAAESVWVSTIHSFVYHNIVKPYAWLLRDEEGEPLVRDLRGHSEHFVDYRTIEEWVKRCKGKIKDYVKQDIPKTAKCLNAIAWTREGDEWIPTVPAQIARNNPYYLRGDKGGRAYFPSKHTQELMEFKEMCWECGDIAHNDVLYLGVRILEKYPQLISFLATAFPYVFVDEFQDTTPMQTDIMRYFGENGSIVGVIGDVNQSIYGFNGATPEDFVNFKLPGMSEYKISGNRRSTVTIVNFLNEMRDDLVQHPIRKEQGGPVIVLVEPSSTRVAKAVRQRLEKPQTDIDDDEFAVLVRRNEEVLSIRYGYVGGLEELWQSFRKVDSTRAGFYERIIKFVESCRTERADDAADYLTLLFSEDGINLRRPLKKAHGFHGYVFDELAIALLEGLLPFWIGSCDSSLMDVNNDCLNPLLMNRYRISLPRIAFGKTRRFAESTRFADLIRSSETLGYVDPVRTIHKAKGSEFNTVLVCLKDEGELLRYYLDKSSEDEGEKRVRYVAASRAKDRLYIHVPALSQRAREKARRLGLEVRDIA